MDRIPLRLILCSLLILLAVGCSDDDPVAVQKPARDYTVTFAEGTTPTGDQCGVSWSEDGLNLQIVATTDDDANGGGDCIGYNFSEEGCFLAGTRLTVDLTGIDFNRVEVDYVDYCGANGTRAFLYAGETIVAQSSNLQMGDVGTLFLFPEEASVTQLAFSSCESFFAEIRVMAADDPVAPPSDDLPPDGGGDWK